MAARPSLVVEYYPARVTANDDPDKRGRVRVSCVGLLGDDEADLPMWVEPALDWGWFYVPDVGEIIEVSAVTGSAQDESIGQMSLDNLDIKWHGARFYNSDADTPTPINDAFTSSNYGKRRGFATPFGHYLVFDDTEDSPEITLTWTSKKNPGANDITQVDINKNGEVTITVLGQHSILLKPDQMNVQLNGASMNLQSHAGNTTLAIGDGAKHVAIVEYLETLYGNLKSYIENAFVNTGMGPSSTITAANGPAPSWDASIKSTKVTIPDG